MVLLCTVSAVLSSIKVLQKTKQVRHLFQQSCRGTSASLKQWQLYVKGEFLLFGTLMDAMHQRKGKNNTLSMPI